MTTTLDRPPTAPLAERIPAWGVSVDLTPREVVQGRQTKVVQRLVVLGLVVVLLACGGLALMAYGDRSSAQSDFDEAQGQTTQLQAASHAFDELVAMNQAIQSTHTVANGLLAQDVDFVKLMARIRAAVPAEVTITNLSVLLAPEQATGGAPASGEGVDTSIGTVSITGGGTRIKALAPFVARLNHMHGITDVVPTSITQTDSGMAYTMTMSFSDELYSHRFDHTSAGSPSTASPSAAAAPDGAP